MPTISGLSVTLASTIIPGGPVGEHRVPGGLEVGDTLVSVVPVQEGTPPTIAAPLTAEFEVSATKAGVIENDTTVTTGSFLIVSWLKAN